MLALKPNDQETWIDLSEPTYRIHGTPDPSKISKTASHGCGRLTNWDAAELARLVKPGILVTFVEASKLCTEKHSDGPFIVIQ